LTVAHLGDRGRSRKANLLLRTDWHRHATDPATYRDGLPRIGDELAAWCVAHRVKILGVEPPSIADVEKLTVSSDASETRGGVTIVEGLAHLDSTHAARVFFHALPLRLSGGDGCPVRAFAYDTPAEMAAT
jgi:kynurenine formamidase